MGFQASWHCALAARLATQTPEIRVGFQFGRQLFLNLFDRAAGKRGTVVLVDVPGGIFGPAILVLDHPAIRCLFSLCFQASPEQKLPRNFSPFKLKLDFSLFPIALGAPRLPSK